MKISGKEMTWGAIAFVVFCFLGKAIVSKLTDKVVDAPFKARERQDAKKDELEKEGRQEERDQRRQAEQDAKNAARVEYLPPSKWVGDNASLTFHDASPVLDAAITEIEFAVSDPSLLAEIERRHPKPKEVMAERGNLPVDLYFRKGDWSGGFGGDWRYYFVMNPGQHLKKGGEPEDFRFAIVNQRLAGLALKGKLTINYVARSEPGFLFMEACVVEPVTLRVRAKD